MIGWGLETNKAMAKASYTTNLFTVLKEIITHRVELRKIYGIQSKNWTDIETPAHNQIEFPHFLDNLEYSTTSLLNLMWELRGTSVKIDCLVFKKLLSKSACVRV